MRETAFAAERVLGNVISSGIKVLVLAVIVGIGSTLFSQFTSGFAGGQPTIEDAMTLVLAALSLLGLGIFGPGIANGLVSGGPQLGAGAAIGTGLAAGGVVAAGAGLAAGAAGLASGAVAGSARGGGAVLSRASAAYRNGGFSGVAEAGNAAAMSPLRHAAAALGRGGKGVNKARALRPRGSPIGRGACSVLRRSGMARPRLVTRCAPEIMVAAAPPSICRKESADTTESPLLPSVSGSEVRT